MEARELVTTDPETAAAFLRVAMFAADSEALDAAPPSSIHGPDGRPQRETPAEFTRRIVGAGVMHLVEQGLLVVPGDIAERLEGRIPLRRQKSPVP
jgi:hypothetical protein